MQQWLKWMNDLCMFMYNKEIESNGTQQTIRQLEIMELSKLKVILSFFFVESLRENL